MATRIEELRLRKAQLGDDLRRANLHGKSDHYERLQVGYDRVVEELKMLEARAQRLDEIRTSGTMRPGMPVYVEDAAHDVLTGRVLDPSQDLALRMCEINQIAFTPKALDRVDEIIRNDRFAAREIAAHSTPEYRSAFWKCATAGPAAASVMLTDSERAAMAESFNARNERAQSEGSSGSGGFAIPVQIDPSLIVTDQESPNPIRALARTVECQTSVWKGVASAGVSWSFDSEGSAVSDDGLYSIVQPSVTVFMARGFIPFSIEIEQDWPGFQAEMARVLSIGYDELLAQKFATGSGTGEPRGILTALAASNPTVIVTSMTDGAFGQEDVYSSWAALPAKYRARASWMMSVDVMDRIRQMGTSNVYHAFTGNLTAGAIDVLMGHPVYENPYFPSFNNTTGAANRLVVGAFDEYVIASRSGLTVELVPQLLDTTTGRPTGSRGWFAYARTGGNSVDDRGFALQANT